jgi:hypothetical protein
MQENQNASECKWKKSVLDYASIFSYDELGKDVSEIFPLHSKSSEQKY